MGVTFNNVEIKCFTVLGPESLLAGCNSPLEAVYLGPLLVTGSSWCPEGSVLGGFPALSYLLWRHQHQDNHVVGGRESVW